MVYPPTPGRVVWYYPGKYDGIPHTPGRPLAAMVAHVHDDHMVNLRVIDQNGDAHARTSVPMVHDGEEKPDSAHCTYMPYQAQKHKEEMAGK